MSNLDSNETMIAWQSWLSFYFQKMLWRNLLQAQSGAFWLLRICFHVSQWCHSFLYFYSRLNVRATMKANETEKISMAPFASTTKVNTSFRGWGIKHEDVHGWVLNDLWTWRLQEKHEESHEEPSSVASRGPGGLFILVGLNLFHVDAIEASNNSFVCRVECQIIDNKYISYVSLVFKWSMCRPNLSDLKNS